MFILGTVLVVEIILAVSLFVAANSGYKMVVVTGGSMEPEYHIGSAVLLKSPPNKVPVGEVVTFESFRGVLTTHRVIKQVDMPSGLHYQTQGDANNSPDVDLAAQTNILGVPIWAASNLGYVIDFLFSPLGKLVIFLPPLLVVLYLEVRTIWQVLRDDKGESDGPDEDGPADEDGDAAGFLPGWMTEKFDPVSVRVMAFHNRHPRAVTLGVVTVALFAATACGAAVGKTTAFFIDSKPVKDNTFATTSAAPATSPSASAGITQVNLSWTASASGFVTGYDIFRSAGGAGGPFNKVGSVGPASGSYSDTGLVSSTTYYYRVVAVAGNWNSAPTAVVTATTGPTASGVTPLGYCSTQAAASGGVGNGYETSPLNACGPEDGVYAQDKNSGLGGPLMCGDPASDRHVYGGFGLTVPSGRTVTGLEVRTVGDHTRRNIPAAICIEVSTNGGASWSAAKLHTYVDATAALETVIFGSGTDMWGQSWTPANVGSLSVRISSVSGFKNDTFQLDSIGARFTYQ